MTQDPVRVYEKAHDDYAARFNDGELAEACVVDMLGGRAICNSPAAMVKLEELLEGGFSVRVEKLSDGQVRIVETGGEEVTLSLVRAKNKCNSAACDPTHFRNILNNCILRRGSTSVFVELQVHELQPQLKRQHETC